MFVARAIKDSCCQFYLSILHSVAPFPPWSRPSPLPRLPLIWAWFLPFDKRMRGSTCSSQRCWELSLTEIPSLSVLEERKLGLKTFLDTSQKWHKQDFRSPAWLRVRVRVWLLIMAWTITRIEGTWLQVQWGERQCQWAEVKTWSVPRGCTNSRDTLGLSGL